MMHTCIHTATATAALDRTAHPSMPCPLQGTTSNPHRQHARPVPLPPFRTPRSVKLYVNRASMGFSDVDSVPAAHAVTLTPQQISSGEPIVLKLAKFSNGEHLVGECATVS